MKLSELSGFNERKNVTKYGEESFWEDRYAAPQTFEWFLSLQDAMDQSPPLKSILQSRSRTDCRILEIGCGTSELCENLWDMGFRNVSGLDYCPEAVAFCQKRQGDARKITYTVGDMTKLPFEDASFDIVIDKGALDSLVCKANGSLEQCANELWRVLKAKSSVFISLSNTPLNEIPDGTSTCFQRNHMQLIKNQHMNQFMAKLYLFERRKKKLNK